MKASLICLITICCLLSFFSMAQADVLRVEPELSYDKLRIEGGTPNYSISEPVLKVGMDSETDLGFIRLGVALGYGNIRDFSYLTVTPRAGWEFGIQDYRIKLYEGYKVLNVKDFTSSTTSYDFSGFIFGAEIESKISEMFAWTGSITIPETCSYRRNGELITDSAFAQGNITQTDWSIGLKFTLLPVYDILIGYHATEVFAKDQSFKIASNGVTASVNITF